MNIYNAVEKKLILYIGRYGLPVDAPGIRVNKISGILKRIGYKIIHISELSLEHNMDIVNYGNEQYSFKKYRDASSIVVKICNLINILLSYDTIRRFRLIVKNEKPFAIILYNDILFLSIYMIVYCKLHNIKLINDVTEWYDYNQSESVIAKILYRMVNIRIRVVDKYIHNTIVISNYLYNWYSRKYRNVVFIPPICEQLTKSNICYRHIDDYSPRHIVYAGNPLNKDILNSVFDSIVEINKVNIKIVFDVIGVDARIINEAYKISNPEKYGIVIHGKKSHEDTISITKKADFGILLRPNRRYAKAGYSTKFAECMSMGVPMICNKVGGIDAIIINEYNGFLIHNTDKPSVSNMLVYISGLKNEELNILKANALVTAISIFSEDVYIDIAYRFISDLK
jgi:glycosyltransferase involved in cell wall biosynthesis